METCFKYSQIENIRYANVLIIASSILQNLFDSKLYHGDIKPSNISMSPGFQPKLFDYDISVILSKFPNIDADIVIEEIRGLTPEFAPPEILSLYLKG